MARTIGYASRVRNGISIWDQWNDFMEAIKGEVSTLRFLWLWSQHVPDLGTKLRESMRQYLTVTIQDEWRPSA